MYKLPEIDKLREQRWDIVRLLIYQLEELNKDKIINYPFDDVDVVPDIIVDGSIFGLSNMKVFSVFYP